MALGDLDIRRDDLTNQQTLDLVREHLRGMHENSPAGNVFALDLTGLQASDVTVWSAWIGESVAGICALRDLGDGTGELKSMRTSSLFLRRGVAAGLLEHVIQAARARKMTRLHLETGSGAAFEPALALYRKRGFVPGEAFAGYKASSFNQFLQMDL